MVEAYVALKDELKSDVVDVQKGIKVVMDALLAPIAQIAENAGYNAEDIVDQQKHAEENVGFDAKVGEWVNMFEKELLINQSYKKRIVKCRKYFCFILNN